MSLQGVKQIKYRVPYQSPVMIYFLNLIALNCAI